MANSFQFMQAVDTPRGAGYFIGYMDDGHNAQVAQWIQRDGKRIQVNRVYPVSTITPRKADDHRKPKPAPVSQVADAALG